MSDATTQVTCYHCGALTADWVMDRVETYRDTWGSQNDFRAVHAHRGICQALQDNRHAEFALESARQGLVQVRELLAEAEASLAETEARFHQVMRRIEFILGPPMMPPSPASSCR